MRWYKTVLGVDFIGTDHSNIEVDFIGGDSADMFAERAPTQSPDWLYHTKKFTYKFNDLGHRTKRLSELDFDNYVLYVGCSHTMGVGLEEETIYPHLLSKELGMDYYNLALPATGIDVLEYNLLTWISTTKKQPKLIVVQWPDHSRYIEYDPIHNHLMERGTWMKEDRYSRFVVAAEQSGLYYARKHLLVNLLKSSIKTKVIYCNFGGQMPYELENLSMRKYDVARDLAHSGIISHNKFTEALFNRISLIRD